LLPGRREQGLQALIPEKRHGSPWSLRHAAWTVLLVATTGLSAVLAGCSGLAANNGEVPATGPDLSYREVIASHLKKTFKNYSTYDSFEISDPRWVHSMKGWNWLTCVRFQDHGHLRIYAVFLNGEKIIDDRYAVQTDNCDLQTYVPFERSSSGLDPLH
jgi:hypothetical protein